MRILVIEDDEGMRLVVRRMLESAGHEVAEAENGSAGMRLFEQGGYDAVVTDLIMPEKEGIETIVTIRQSDKAVRVVAMSGGAQVGQGDYLKMAAGLGANATLNKPFTKQDLLRALAS